MLRHRVGLLAALMVLAGCGGGSDLISQADLTRQQESTDGLARLVVSTLVDQVAAKPPSKGSLGLGLLAGCDGGDPDQASYFLDTFVTYPVQPLETAAADVAAALRSAGLTVSVDAATSEISTSRDGVTVDLTTQEKGGGSAGQNIFVSTDCLAIGKQQIAAFNQAPAPVSP